MDEERQRMRKEQEKRVKEEQKVILGKNNSRPKLSFSGWICYFSPALRGNTIPFAEGLLRLLPLEFAQGPCGSRRGRLHHSSAGNERGSRASA